MSTMDKDSILFPEFEPNDELSLADKSSKNFTPYHSSTQLRSFSQAQKRVVMSSEQHVKVSKREKSHAVLIKDGEENLEDNEDGSGGAKEKIESNKF